MRDAKPNRAYRLLKDLINKYTPRDSFIITENDMGFLEKSGFNMNRVWEIFGNANYFQCGHGKLIYNLCKFSKP